ncbi:MBL fold metallo-hydrolase [Haloplanus rallus]|uniref:MBL fold metallo-hydrolase n=1 Tax=Haloplanus rallus TaxID=1816183 RepID=A0A6B9F9C3_9EURY|nr:lamin tail domain-containing protein [Haloplanus rallus]QGX94841.1 MBL fold metallo-hydrolase [Haloplanus rallus]
MSTYRAVILVLILALAGCSGTGGGAGGLPTDTATETDTPPQAATTTPTDVSGVPSGTLEVHFINVDQSVSTLIVAPSGETMLIDTGDFNDDGEYVLQYLQRQNITRIDHLVVSHNDADHIGGNAAVIEYYETQADGIGMIHDPGIASSTQTYNEYLDAVEEHDVRLVETREGNALSFGGAAVGVQVLGPPDPYLENGARNENSIVLKFTFGSTSFLATGDAENDQEAYLTEQYGTQLRATVLKAGHHGSKTSTGSALLDAVQPKTVVISSAYDSRYGHPSEETLQRLAERSIPTYWTATHGDIVFVSDGRSISVRTQQAAPTDPLVLRDGRPVAPSASDPVTERTRLGGESPDGSQVTSDSRTTETATATMTDGGTVSKAAIAITEVKADAAGNDNDNLNDEYVVLENREDTAVDMSGWTLTDAAAHTYTFPTGFRLPAGEEVTVHTGSGTDTNTDLYWGEESAVWNNNGDTVILRTADGRLILKEEY